jgi:hypothetical protein
MEPRPGSYEKKKQERDRTAVQSKPRERISKQGQKTALQPLSTRYTYAPSRYAANKSLHYLARTVSFPSQQGLNEQRSSKVRTYLQ